MDKKRIDHLLSLGLEPSEADALKALSGAVVEKLKGLQDDYDAKAYKDFQTADDDLGDMVRRLEARYLRKQKIFKNRSAVLRWLQDQGYKIESSKLYQDADDGLLVVQSDKSVLESDVLVYVFKADLKKKGSATLNSKALETEVEEKRREERKKAKVQREKMEFELAQAKGKYLLKTDVYAEIAIKIATLEAGLKNHFRTGVVDWIYKVGGDPKKANMLLTLLYAELDELLNAFGRMDDIGVEIVKGEMDGIESDTAADDGACTDGGICRDDVGSEVQAPGAEQDVQPDA